MNPLVARLACSLAVVAGLGRRARGPRPGQHRRQGDPHRRHVHHRRRTRHPGAPDRREAERRLGPAGGRRQQARCRRQHRRRLGRQGGARRPTRSSSAPSARTRSTARSTPKMPYDMVKDFAPVTLLATTPNLLVVHNDVPAKTLPEFIALGKSEGKMTFASSGSGTSIHVSGELFKTMTGIDMTHIPYKGRAVAIPDLLGGRVTMMFDNMPSSLPLVKEGKLRALGVTSAEALAGRARDPDHRRAGTARIRRGIVVRAVRAGRHAATRRRQAARRGQAHPRAARRRQEAGRGRARAGRIDARRARRLPARRDRQVGQGGQGFGRQGRMTAGERRAARRPRAGLIDSAGSTR